jgi:hypothetical protein
VGAEEPERVLKDPLDDIHPASFSPIVRITGDRNKKGAVSRTVNRNLRESRCYEMVLFCHTRESG